MANDEAGTGTSAENEAPTEALGMTLPPKEDEVQNTVDQTVKAEFSDTEKGSDENEIPNADETYDDEVEGEDHALIIRIGDLFQSQDMVLMLNILDVIEPIGEGRSYKIRDFASIADSALVSEKDLLGYIKANGLTKLATYRDRMEEISKVLILNEGDIFTRNGELYLEVLTAEMLYMDPNDKGRNVIGVKYADGLVSFVDALEVKASVYENTDQFPPQNL